MENRKRMERKLNKIIGITDDKEIIMLHYLFCDGSSFYGVTVNKFDFYDADTLENLNSDDYIKDYYADIWREAVLCGNTEDSLKEFAESCHDGDLSDGCQFPGHDLSYGAELSRAFDKLPDARKEFLLLLYGIDKDNLDYGSFDLTSSDNSWAFNCCGGGRGLPDKSKSNNINWFISSELLARLQTFDAGKFNGDPYAELEELYKLLTRD